MPDAVDPLLQLQGVSKDYRSLRPLRIRDLTLHPGEALALLGLDEAMAGVLVDLLTAGSLPDAGHVTVFGESTATIATREDWLVLLDRFGLVSDRSVLLDQLTVEQNLAIPLSLEVQQMSAELRSRVRVLADEVRLLPTELSEAFGRLAPARQLRVRLGRALALQPHVLLAEHPTLRLSPDEARSFAGDLKNIVRSRRIGMLVCTADARFARDVADKVLTLQPATGELKSAARWSWR